MIQKRHATRHKAGHEIKNIMFPSLQKNPTVLFQKETGERNMWPLSTVRHSATNK